MYRELIDHLTFVYSFICKGRGQIKEDSMWQISQGARAMTENAPAVLAKENATRQDEQDLMECGKIMEHIDEMIVFFNTTEII